MKYVVLGALVGVATLVSLLMVGLNQPAKALPFCLEHPDVCQGVQSVPLCVGCPLGLFNWQDIITLPENQSLSVSVHHGPISDTVMVDIPKVLSGPLLNSSMQNGSMMGGPQAGMP